MATFTAKKYGQADLDAYSKLIDWVADAQRLRLTSSAYVPNQDTDSRASHLSDELTVGNGYTADGFLIGTRTRAYNAATNETKLDGDDVIVAAPTTLTWRNYHVVDHASGSDATRPLLCYGVGDADTISTGGETRITFNAAGIIVNTAA